ncbi:MAG: flagellar export chaperone FliS [Gammaproteobacteria bacterium]|nr:flagellar export chaperone FliS [Gammaproteobacteria bacterium]MBU1602878.1 flagellar export chaperone FliS [Gammaproteobacteria bacterium]MBU2432550.1 flagellar export chaperone FliS [Gammaproteobacteria bacterium]MBU2448907.1 flagellar export chaperone FliS [Gammaproteobacteria bacterium]
MFSSPIASYKQISIESDVRGADPHRLIVLLFDGAESALQQAQTRLAANDFKGKSDSLMKAIDIILSGLSASLDTEQGGDLAQNLKALYDYMASRLIHANVHKDANAIREVQGLLGEIASAWREIGVAGRQSPDQQT